MTGAPPGPAGAFPARPLRGAPLWCPGRTPQSHLRVVSSGCGGGGPLRVHGRGETEEETKFASGSRYLPLKATFVLIFCPTERARKGRGEDTREAWTGIPDCLSLRGEAPSAPPPPHPSPQTLLFARISLAKPVAGVSARAMLAESLFCRWRGGRGQDSGLAARGSPGARLAPTALENRGSGRSSRLGKRR